MLVHSRWSLIASKCNTITAFHAAGRSEYRTSFEQEWLKELDKESIAHNEDSAEAPTLEFS